MPRPLMTLLVAAVLLAGSFPASAQDFESQNNSVELLTIAAHNLYGSLSDEQKEQGTFPLGHEEWTNIRLAPFGAAGLKFKDMSPGQIALVHTIANAGFSASGYHKIGSIIALEEYNDIISGRADKDDNAHGIHNYSISIFGTPAPQASWGFRLHGHHLYLSLGVADGKLVSTSPTFFGGQPHEVTEGPRKGWHVLRDEEIVGRNLYLSLSNDQRAKADIDQKRFPRDVFSGNNPDISDLKSDQGLAFTDMTNAQQEMLRAIVMEHVYHVPRDLAYSRLDKIEKGGWDDIRFSWIGSTEKFEKMYYSVRGAEFLIEYCVTSIGENHIHSVWREFNGDFGKDILAQHLRSSPH